jgi:hypothetical protein
VDLIVSPSNSNDVTMVDSGTFSDAHSVTAEHVFYTVKEDVFYAENA